MKKQTKTLLARCLLPSLVGLIVAPTILPPTQVIAATTTAPLTLTYSKVNAETGQIKVTFGTGVKRVLLPTGTSVTQSTSIEVKENGTYDFVAYDANERPTQQQITVSGLDVDSAPITIANGLYMKLHVDVFDTISGVDSYRYKLDNTSTWSSWIPYQGKNSHDILIPATSSTSSFIDNRSMVVEIKDKAGNVKTTQSNFRVDHYYPEIQAYQDTIYTNTGKITIPLITNSYFKSPEKLTIKEGTKVTPVDLTKVKSTETLLSRRPNLYKTDWGNKITYEVAHTQGARNLELVVTKSYIDFKGNRVDLSSDRVTKRVVNVIYDTVAPTGTVRILANAKNEVSSHNVTLDLSFLDEMSGVAKVRVYEGNKEYTLTQAELKDGHFTLPWTLSMGKDGQVFMDVTDKAGNSATFTSNKVTVSNLQISGFTLTDVVNPTGPYKDTNGTIKEFPANGLNWQFNGNQVRMVAGGNFSFKLYYDIGFVNPNRYVVSGTYKVTLVEGTQTVYTSPDIPYTQGFNENNPSGDAGFSATFALPSVKSNGQPFNDGTKVYITSSLKRVEKADGSTINATFQSPNSSGNLIGIIGHYDGAMSMNDMVRFNEKN